ncbi:hypothetical protein COCC4DRAFT_144753 [Bipolaris maydis ATCC 48331]|uniref:Ecp2 effector protein domain-containing protein n=2 Tax=Cochliobolus heterostrophus TaxID=5016 RepID=M2UVY0_COCH5|nr:uncharacterized protein COCC4DRAFT_144753 [Bipolaris maydis ATCC 48331]EMD91998.1 hypothetical protein COCHEDRAFT_1213092 [Bipolaris maydis C5]KAH7553227.1 hypothetical protein BM1_08200 [Bipolaris maydis]ENI02519.1 hypothetical protein COCC4DRAFT_144753 [Bipolaris maydis ATCC 48331]KAJ5021393.1 hypothetical protein J3E73DRAFT_262084 [Bipolaris maydis]KAJ6198464.1 hypothetical protein J3E72DRAFT_268693 [Bipolaris maydis]
MHSSPVLAAALAAFFGLSSALALPSDVDTRNVIQPDVAIIARASSAINAAIQTLPTLSPSSWSPVLTSPFTCRSPPQDILDGFYDQVNALQGQPTSFYTGAAWRAQDSGILCE